MKLHRGCERRRTGGFLGTCEFKDVMGDEGENQLTEKYF
jgi:hypothetical protein